MAKRWDTCSGDALPAVQLAFEKRACIRSGGEQLSQPRDIAAFVHRTWGCKPQEVFLVIHFNAANIPLAVHEVSLGGVAQTAVDPKVVFGGALASGASALVLVHNHPSGNPEPSQMDLEMTRQLMKAAQYLSIKILDHVIVARGGAYSSLLEKGLMPRALGDEEIQYPRMR